jgi:5-methylcytosine-specific restriction protein B
MVLYMLFPDDFERIFGQRDRKAVLQAFSGLDVRTVNAMDAAQLDRALRETRRNLETEYKTTELDYYLAPLRGRWGPSDFEATANAITADHVRLALAEIDRDGIPPNAQSTGYDLIEAGRRYPPKLVFSLAAKQATGHELDRGFFSGGEKSQAFKVLQKLGFEISSKDLIAPLVEKFLQQGKAGDDLTVRGYLDVYRGLEVRVSFGQGNFARIPWIAFLAKGQSVSNGIYPVILYFRDRNVLLLCYGISETRQPGRSWGGIQSSAQTVSEWFRSRFGAAPERYGQSYVRAAYEGDIAAAIDELKRELDLIIDQYEEILGVPEIEGEILPMRADLGEASRSFSSALKRANVDFGPTHDSLVASFVACIATKPLLILTGLSGSGKTQIAMKFGQWLGDGRLHLVAVRPDWTGAESLFGYEDGLKPAIDGRPAWHVPAPLKFMLQACHDLQHPYLLLLDEMNLAHVERYFADVLSGMESGEPCLPNLEKGTDGLWREAPGAPPKLAFPRNLWIIGTVNVDETTYMFSPKVLDRASTFEFRVAAGDLQSAGRKPARCEPGEPAVIRGLLSIAQDDEWHQLNRGSFDAQVVLRLRLLHEVLARYSLEFGHRVFYEAQRFSALAQKAGLGAFESVLDRIVLQKILPRLHGSRRRLELPLLALCHFCRDLPEVVEPDAKLRAFGAESAATGAPRLPLSYYKLCRMLRNLRENQFASFTE